MGNSRVIYVVLFLVFLLLVINGFLVTEIVTLKKDLTEIKENKGNLIIEEKRPYLGLTFISKEIAGEGYPADYFVNLTITITNPSDDWIDLREYFLFWVDFGIDDDYVIEIQKAKDFLAPFESWSIERSRFQYFKNDPPYIAISYDGKIIDLKEVPLQ